MMFVWLGTQVPVAGTMWGRTVVLALALTVGNVFAGGGGSGSGEPVTDNDQLRLGRGINVFSRYGYVSEFFFFFTFKFFIILIHEKIHQNIFNVFQKHRT